jgi:predicted HicB family RNase H-like nuclease
MAYVSSDRQLSKVLRVRVSPEMLAQLVERAGRDYRSAGSVARDAIRSYLAKGKR